LPFLRYAFLLRLEAQGSPSLANPLDGTAIHWMAVVSVSPLGNSFGGVKVHWSFTAFRLTHSYG